MKLLISLLLAMCVSVTANAKTVEVKTMPQLVQTLKTQGPIVVLFTAEWCPGCKIFHPVYETLSEQMSMQFLTIDMDNPDMLPVTAGIPQMPTVMVLSAKKDGENLSILGCLVDAPNKLEVVKVSILKCLVEMK